MSGQPVKVTQKDNNRLNPKTISIVGDGSGELSHNRKMNALSVRQAATWDGSVVNITKVTLEIIPAATGTAEFPATVGVVFDAPTDAVADAWLSDDAALNSDTQLDTLTVGKPETWYFPEEIFPNGLIRLDALRLKGADAFDLIIKAN